MDISIDAQLALELQWLEEDEVENMENKENMIMRDGEFVTMMQQQEEDKAQKLMEKEQWDMSSMPTGKALLLIQNVLYLHHVFKSSIPQNLGVASKVTTLATDSMFFLADHLLHLQAVFIVAREKSLWT